MWYIDVLVVGVVVLFTVRGFFKGFFGASNGLFGRFGGFVSSIAVSSVLSMLMKQIGVVDFLTDCYKGLLSEKLKIAFFTEKIAEILAMISVVVGCFIICKWTVKCFFKTIHRFFSSIREISPLFKRVDGALGIVVGGFVSCVLILGVFGFVYFLENYGYVNGISQIISDCSLSCKIYENNPIIELLNDTPIIERVTKIIS